MFRQVVKAVVPKSLVRWIRERKKQFAIDRAMKTFDRWPIGQAPPKELLQRLVDAWDNNWSAQWEYLSDILQRLARIDGAVLECGSGLTTLLVGKWCDRLGKPVYTLEHDAEWAKRINWLLARYRIKSVHLSVAPIVGFDGYEWYDAPLTEIHSAIGLVICDGPPGGIQGGRVGLLPRTRANLSSNCTILLDDAARSGEQEVLKNWEQIYKVQFRMHGTEKPFAVVSV